MTRDEFNNPGQTDMGCPVWVGMSLVPTLRVCTRTHERGHTPQTTSNQTWDVMVCAWAACILCMHPHEAQWAHIRTYWYIPVQLWPLWATLTHPPFGSHGSLCVGRHEACPHVASTVWPRMHTRGTLRRAKGS